MNCKFFFLWWRIGELQKCFYRGEKLNCRMFALVARMLTAKYFLWWREGELQNFFSGGE